MFPVSFFAKIPCVFILNFLLVDREFCAAFFIPRNDLHMYRRLRRNLCRFRLGIWWNSSSLTAALLLNCFYLLQQLTFDWTVTRCFILIRSHSSSPLSSLSVSPRPRFRFRPYCFGSVRVQFFSRVDHV